MMTFIPRSLQDYVLQACAPIYQKTSLCPPPCLFEAGETEQRIYSEYAADCLWKAGVLEAKPVLYLQIDGSHSSLALAEEQLVDAVCSGWSNGCEQLVSAALVTGGATFDENVWRETARLLSDLSRQTLVFLFTDSMEDRNGMLGRLQNELSRLRVFPAVKSLSIRSITDCACCYIRRRGFEIADEETFRKHFVHAFSAVRTCRQAEQVAEILMDCAEEAGGGWVVSAESIVRAGNG